MHYKESNKILERIKKADEILINCHMHPDADSVGSSLALYQAVKDMDKSVRVLCPDGLPPNLKFLPFSGEVEQVDYRKFDFSQYNLFICLDSASWEMVVGKAASSKIPIPDIPIIVIDHHKTNEEYGYFNLVDDKATSSAEMVYLILEDWGFNVDKNISTSLLSGIIADTGVFQYPGVPARTLNIAGKLMQKGADKDEIIHNVYRSYDFKLLKFWGEVLKRMQIEKDYRFVWSAVPSGVYEKLGSPGSARETAASMFSQVVEGTDFGITMIEESKGKLAVSLRSRTGFDTTKITLEMGGGGHAAASGARLEDYAFDEGIDRVLGIAKKHARKTKR